MVQEYSLATAPICPLTLACSFQHKLHPGVSEAPRHMLCKHLPVQSSPFSSFICLPKHASTHRAAEKRHHQASVSLHIDSSQTFPTVAFMQGSICFTTMCRVRSRVIVIWARNTPGPVIAPDKRHEFHCKGLTCTGSGNGTVGITCRTNMEGLDVERAGLG